MTAAMRMGDAWGLAAETDRRFWQWFTRLGVPALAFALLMPRLHLQAPPLATPPLRPVQLLPDAPPPPLVQQPPKPVAPEAPKPAPRAVARAATPPPKAAATIPTTPAAAAATAREVAEQAGLMTLRNQLAAMQDRRLTAVSQPQVLTTTAALGHETSRGNTQALTAASQSGGASRAAAGLSHLAAATGVGERRTGTVQSRLAMGTEQGAPRGNGRREGGRSLEEIQLGFDRSKSAFNVIFSRAAREQSGLGAGRVVVSLTIAADGSVSRCELVSSSFNSPELEAKIIQRVRMLNFGARDVPAFNYPNYPIDFLPS